MAEQNEIQQTHSCRTSATLHSTSSQSDVESRRDKKKKMAAFESFLKVKPDDPPLEILPRRMLSNLEAGEEVRLGENSCRICRQYLTSIAKLCEFCRETVCAAHFRKRRRNNSTNKWTRICELCEDRYLMDKHSQNQLKNEEALLTQEIIVTNRHRELAEAIQKKKQELMAKRNKKEKIGEERKKEIERLEIKSQDVEATFANLQKEIQENRNFELSLSTLEQKLPPSLQADFEFLHSQSARITKDLIKYERLCGDAIKSRSQREKDMYREYYQWEQQKRRELEEKQKQEEECTIY